MDQAIILSVGDELVLGQTVDTNSAWLSDQLASRGINTRYHQTLADDQAQTARAIAQASKAAPLVIISGGIGPTDDDLTRQALAEAMGVELVEDADALEAIRTMMEKRGRIMAPRNRVQAMHPAGSVMINNTCGSAPGLHAKLNNAEVFVIPGVPREMRTMYELSIAPLLPRSRTILTEKINTFGNGESNVAEQLGDLCDRTRNPLVGTTVADGVVSVRVRAEYGTHDEAAAAMADTIAQVEAAVAPLAYSHGSVTLGDVVVPMLIERGLTVATAESCTGGLVGGALTDVAGSSAAYRGGWVTYTNEMKATQLGVDPNLIEQHGAVSGPVAEAMAQGAAARSGADLAVSLTGVAGPDGGTDEKPVGTVWIALHDAKAGNTEAKCFALSGDRATVRDRAVKTALQWLRLHMLGESVEGIRWIKADKDARLL